MYDSPCPFTRTMLAALRESAASQPIELKVLDCAPVPERAVDFFIAVQIINDKPGGGTVAFFWVSSSMSIQKNLADFYEYVAFVAQLPSGDQIPQRVIDSVW